MICKPRGKSWTLELPKDAELINTLERIPGLKIEIGNNVMSGSADAVGAGAVLLGAPTPARWGSVGTCDDPRLRSYQREGVVSLNGIMQMTGGALLADDVGLGKTLQAITLMKNTKGRVLVVCPAYVRETWRDELTKWGETDAVVLGPRKNKKATEAWDTAKDRRIVVTSYEMAKQAMELAFSARAPQLLVMDEIHLVKGRTNARAKEMQNIAMLSTYKLGISATPSWNRPRDIFQLLRILFGTRFGSGWDFDRRYCGGQLNEWGGMENKGATNTDELKQRLSYYMVRREKSEVGAELPPLSRQVMWVDCTEEARIAFERAMLSTSDAGAIARALEATHQAKLEPAMELAVQAKKFLMFTWRRDHAKQMAKVLHEERDTPCVAVTGEMNTEQRMAQCKMAQANGWGVVATIDAAGAGLNLQGIASTGIMHAIDWVPAKMAQAEGRLHRMGQTLPVQWIYVAMKDSMDSLVVRTVVDKMDQHRAILGGVDSLGLRDALGDRIDGAGSVVDEAAALSALYESMKSMESPDDTA